MTEELDAGTGLVLLNLKDAATTSHPRRSSTIDLSWANQRAFGKVLGWKVEHGVDSLLDHFYIFLNIKTKCSTRDRAKLTNSAFPRWSMKRLDKDLLEAAAAAKTWAIEGDKWSESEWVNWLGTAFTEILDVITSRAKSGHGPACYWWSEEIAELRRTCNKHRRRAYRARGKAPLEIQKVRQGERIKENP
ncbi:uncharacterized protein LOC105200168 [Solenopsis invicta]|uniref:uncharacterized protein LOC105200168 n=1 Tax=Solenopsis invicta TaxID=13686 RepID=UPI000595FBA9|nr:uncharacterized protein LOC105200168 [Solenopsis invicta]